MKILKKRNNRDDTIKRVVNYLSHFDSKYRHYILNGNYKSLANWSVLNEILFFEDHCEKVLPFFILKYEIDLNLRNKKGVSFFHLYLLLLFYHSGYRNSEKVDYFIDLLRFGLLPNHFMIINHVKIYSLLDLLYLLQNDNKKILPKGFFPKSLDLRFEKLSKENYDKIYLNLLMQKETFFHVKEQKEIEEWDHLTIYDIDSNEKLRKYILEKYNLPLKTEKIPESIVYLLSNIDFYESTMETKKFPLGITAEDTNYIFVNPDFVNNAQLQSYTFMKPVENKYRFHQTFFSNLIKTKTNPFTRNKIDEKTLDSMIEHYHTIFPISTLRDNLEEFPFVFHKTKNKDTQIGIQNLISFIESFFIINHPYNQIFRLQNLKPYEIKYLSYVMMSETKLFPSFEKCYTKTNPMELLKVFLFYCRSKTNYLNVIYYFMEEIFQDLNCYDKIQHFLEDFEEHYPQIFDVYTSRFNISNSHYFSKFIKNIYLIRKFHKN